MRKLLLILLLSCTTTQATEVDEARVQALSEKLRCLVCQNQSIAESDADLAKDLKRQVREMFAAGKSDQEAIDFLVERYGDFVLYDPPLRTSTTLLWLGPLALLGAALLGFIVLLRRRNAASPRPASRDEAALRRAQALLDADNEKAPTP